MIKKMACRGIISMLVTGFINQLVMYITILVTKGKNFIPLVPSFLEHFTSPSEAMLVQYFLVSLIGAAFGVFSVFFEIETWSFLKQGILHFLCTSIVWIPVSIFTWGFYRYPSAIISTVISFLFTYGITWICNYMRCKKTIDTINDRIRDRKKEEIS